ncbi:MAG: Holliday junction branch migration protein RuvA [Candidatus Moranbacteria bacterium]|nr:Holliday junction branch migration protein RuvA [Candidatus Moranbacteria bacterium]
MIAKIRGKIEYLKDSYAVVDVDGIGYKIFLTSHTLGKIASVGEVEFFVHTHVREDILALYGFLTMEELEMFELLIAVSGVGPKAGLGILSIASPKTIRTAILNDDPSILTKVSGVGKKTAERVILELKNKVADLSIADRKEVMADSDALEALTSMGYTVSESREALKHIPAEIKDVGERVKMALKNLGKR